MESRPGTDPDHARKRERVGVKRVRLEARARASGDDRDRRNQKPIAGLLEPLVRSSTPGHEAFLKPPPKCPDETIRSTPEPRTRGPSSIIVRHGPETRASDEGPQVLGPSTSPNSTGSHRRGKILPVSR